MITLTSFFVNELRLSEKDAKENEKQALELLDKWQKEKAEREKQEKNECTTLFNCRKTRISPS